MPSRKTTYGNIYGGRGFSMYVDIKDALPDIWEAMPQETVAAVKEIAQQAKDAHEGETPMKSGQLRENTKIVGYVNGAIGGTVYIQWNARNKKDGFKYAEAQETGGESVGTYYATYTTPGTGPWFMRATHDTIVSSLGNGVADGLQNLIDKNKVN